MNKIFVRHNLKICIIIVLVKHFDNNIKLYANLYGEMVGKSISSDKMERSRKLGRRLSRSVLFNLQIIIIKRVSPLFPKK